MQTQQTLPTVLDCKTASISQLEHAYYNSIPISGITTIATHYEPHNDEIGGGYLLQKTPQGKSRFPGIENASFGPISATKLRAAGYYGEEGFFKALQKQTMLIGVGEGPLDEHGDRERRVSCFEQIYRLLDLGREKDDRKVYANLIRYINFEDNNGDNLIEAMNHARSRTGSKLTREETDALQALQIGSLALNMKKGFEAASGNAEEQRKVFAMAYQFYDNEISQTRKFLEAEMFYEKNIKQYPLTIPGSEHSFVLLEMQTDKPLMNKVIMSKWRDNRQTKFGILFLHKPNGQFVLMPNKQYITPEQMWEIAKILKQRIFCARTKSYLSFSEIKDLAHVPDLYFDEGTGIISNGSKTDPDVPGLLNAELTLQHVYEAVRIGINKSYFAREFEEGCRHGQCVKSKCWMYHFGLKRCHEVRDTMKKEQRPMGNAMKAAFVKKAS